MSFTALLLPLACFSSSFVRTLLSIYFFFFSFPDNLYMCFVFVFHILVSFLFRCCCLLVLFQFLSFPIFISSFSSLYSSIFCLPYSSFFSASSILCFPKKLSKLYPISPRFLISLRLFPILSIHYKRILFHFFSLLSVLLFPSFLIFYIYTAFTLLL